MKSIIPNIFIENCKENLDYYKNIFGGEIKNIIPHQDSPEKLMHAELHINQQCVLFFGDLLEQSQSDVNMHIFLMLDTEEEIQKIYDALNENAKNVLIELQKSFWGSLHAVLMDKNGIIWDLDK
ncbi:VOC family protein [Neobacillus sp. PS3-40]|uniref:VOC family protein n=1 Tax=Neobacillus sp. PS3-40 TaxID=3070679 RepID=UPI0027DEDA87|nr:VOC family protein [Neobacillus sp. PS3-40]WML44288.1 VOC family protein [Neobacillus sp. PS3-40]